MSPFEYYNSRVEESRSNIKRLRDKSRLMGISRLLIFGIGVTAVVLLWTKWLIITGIILVSIVSFLILVSIHENLRRQLKFHKNLLKINEQEISVANGDLSENVDGQEYAFDSHPYNRDLDLFGNRSLFHFINRTTTKIGEFILAEKLNSNNIDGIKRRQEMYSELSQKADWRQNFSANMLIVEDQSQIKMTSNWFKSHESFLPKLLGKLPLVFGLISVVLMVLVALGLNYWYLIGWMFLGLGIVGKYLKRTSKLYLFASKSQDVLNEYASVIELLELEKFESEELKEIRSKVIDEQVVASIELRKFNRLIELLGNRMNFLLTPILNGWFLWDFIYVSKIENWMEKHGNRVEQWVDVIHELDSMNSLGNYVFNHPKNIFPRISENNEQTLKAKGLGHPLIARETCIKNDVVINKSDFYIITGANMAGKSTFLRTVGLNIVLSNVGVSVPSEEFDYNPIKLISSMRTSDSLADDVSYFFSELKRLKFIVDEIESETYFIILDEILKGTNSKDKAEGSEKFVERLVKSGSTGLIATHDLSLCKLGDRYDAIKNYYFDAEIINDELNFDYKMKKGICQNMNASFLLRKMKIV